MPAPMRLEAREMARRDGKAPESAYKALSRALEGLAGQVEPPWRSDGVCASVALPAGGMVTVEVTGPRFREEALALARALAGTAGEDEAYRRGWRDCAALALKEAHDMVDAIEELDERGRL